MSSTRRFIGCSSGYGRFGIGLHFAQLVEESRAADELYGYSSPQLRSGDERIGIVIQGPKLSLFKRKIVRPSQAQKYAELSLKFEEIIAQSIPTGANTLMVFAGRALEPMKRARELGYETIELISPTSHISNVFRRHRAGMNDAGIVDTWLSEASRDRILQEYEKADKIYAHTDYTRDSFIKEGFPLEKLVRTYLVPNPRFVPPENRLETSGFHIAYVGRLDTCKGIHLLVDAFQRLEMPDARLRLVGGWTTRGMKKFVQNACKLDSRIQAAPGDPLPVLHRSDVLVHPSYEDGFAYAPVEALCTGVPVVVTEDTGMKEFVVPGDNGYVIPSGDSDALVQALRKVRNDPPRFDATELRKQFYP